MANWQKLEIGLPFKVTAVQAIQWFEFQNLRPRDIELRLAAAGVSDGSMRQALSRARKLKRQEKVERQKRDAR